MDEIEVVEPSEQHTCAKAASAPIDMHQQTSQCWRWMKSF
jgi:hypothetical protein